MTRVTNFIAVLTLTACCMTGTPVLADATEIRLARNYSIGYLQLMLIEHDDLIQKHAKAAGLGDVKVHWSQFASGSISNDALLAGELDVATGGVPPFVTLWSKTRGVADVRGIAASSTFPMYLNTTDPKIKSIRDFGQGDRIAVAGAGSSIQTIVLQMASAREFGLSNHAKLDPLMVNLSNPDGMVAMLQGKQIKSHITSPPYQYDELERPGVRRVFSSYDVFGGPVITTLIWTTGKFRDQNPKLYSVLLSAFKDATDTINRDKQYASEVYRKLSKTKASTAQILKMIADPQTEFTIVPQNTMKVIDFMHATGRLKVKPTSWKDLFFPEVHILAGS